MTDETFHNSLKRLMKEYAHLIYKISKNFPRKELFGISSQIRRSSLSVALNYVEGYARGRIKENKKFLDISYASLKEAEFTLDFAKEEGFEMNQNEYNHAKSLSDKIGGMLWSTKENMK
ncbi:four helix bundle protein [Candidatus Falkowbacteria bacterium CG10_big_fil_rev_8_21_14_0_10_39_11]|uniref:Four helix bundle protein n=1 Tax=Candidatus Falkowbacteria bacterium CG10_big_fil_rev_8_21_14_0_10_39_11 TaxID=1974565 RepID=A0A2H0V528_9BACT|nr:MAG: four helix bundle protein [Candidatus Falkowbacteria bacterium CG10_big_fil_rev_8_21_14_0_10_39_11]